MSEIAYVWTNVHLDAERMAPLYHEVTQIIDDYIDEEDDRTIGEGLNALAAVAVSLIKGMRHGEVEKLALQFFMDCVEANLEQKNNVSRS